MARIMRSGCLNLLILLVLSTKLMKTSHAQPPPISELTPSPAPVSEFTPSPAPISKPAPSPAPVNKPAPVPAPVSKPAPSPAPVSKPTPGPAPVNDLAPGPAPVNEPPPSLQPPPPNTPQLLPPPQLSPSPPPAFYATQGSRGLSGRQKAGIVLGVLVGAGLIGLIGMVCIKRNNNMRRTQYAEYARRPDL